MPFVNVNGAALHFAHKPASAGAPTVVFSNSLGTDFRVWDEVVARLPGEFGVLRSDKRSHGLSEFTERASEISAHAGDVLALMDHVKVDKAVLCGLSVGGLIVQEVVRTAPERVSGLILCCTGSKIGNDEMWNSRIAAVEEGGIAALADAVMERWFSPAYRAAGSATLMGARLMLVRQPDAGYAAISRMLRDTDLRDAAASIAVPTLCIAGEYDGSTPPALVKETADRIPGAEYAQIDGVGHIPCVEAPGAVADQIAGFVSRSGLSG